MSWPSSSLELTFNFFSSLQIDRQQFEETVRTLNNLYAEAEKLGGQSYLEGCLACLTAYTIFLCMETHYEKVLKKVSKYIQEQNEKIYAPQGLLLTDPIERGLWVMKSPSMKTEVWAVEDKPQSYRSCLQLGPSSIHWPMAECPYLLSRALFSCLCCQSHGATPGVTARHSASTLSPNCVGLCDLLICFQENKGSSSLFKIQSHLKHRLLVSPSQSRFLTRHQCHWFSLSLGSVS